MSIAPSEVVAGPRVLSQGLRVQHRVSHFSHSRFSELGKVGLFNRGLASTGNAYPSPKSSPRGPMGASQISRFSHSLDFRIGKSGFFGGDAVLRRGRLLDPGSQVLSRGGGNGGTSNFPIFPLPRFSGVGKVGFWPGARPFAGDDSRTRVPMSSPSGRAGARRISRFSHFRRIGALDGPFFLITKPQSP